MSNQASKDLVLKKLQFMHGIPCKAEYLANHSGQCETDDTFPKTRKVVRELIDEGHCIGSNHHGYYIMQSGKEVQSYLNSLLRRQIAISNRIAAVYASGKENGLL